MEVWSLFSGVLGLDLGLCKSGLRPTLAVERDAKCCEAIQANRPKLTLLHSDIKGLTGSDLRREAGFDGDVFLLAGGPPCQSFSPGGKRAALSDPRGNLIFEFFRIVEQIRPRYFLLENVANLVTSALRHRPIKDRPGKHWSLKAYEATGTIGSNGGIPLGKDERASSAMRHLLKSLSPLSYAITFGVVDAADFGAPQHRLRFVMMGSRDSGPIRLPERTHGLQDDQQRYKTLRDAIFDLRNQPGPHSEYTPRVRRFFSMVPPGGNWRSLPPEIQPDALGGAWSAGGGKTGFYRRLDWGSPSPTVTGRANRKGSAFCHPDFDRPLSVRECARLQGFPDSWRLSGSMNAQYQQIGNAVPVHLGLALGKALLDHENRHVAKPSEQKSVELEVMLERSVRRLRAAGRNKAARKTPLLATA